MSAWVTPTDAERASRAAGWDEAVQAVAWAMDNGPTADALRYVADHNPYRVEGAVPIPDERERIAQAIEDYAAQGFSEPFMRGMERAASIARGEP